MRNNGVATAEQKYFDQSDKVIDVASQHDPATNANEILTGPDQVIGAAASVHYLTCANLAVCNYTHCRSPTASISLLMKQKCKKRFSAPFAWCKIGHNHQHESWQ